MFTLICTLEYKGAFTPFNNTFALFSTFFTTVPVYCKSKENSFAANTVPVATKNYRKNHNKRKYLFHLNSSLKY